MILREHNVRFVLDLRRGRCQCSNRKLAMKLAMMVSSAFLAVSAMSCTEPSVLSAPVEVARPEFGKTVSQNMHATFTITNSVGFDLLGDGRFLNVTGDSQYADSQCGVTATIFIDNGGGDAVMQTNNPKSETIHACRAKCGCRARRTRWWLCSCSLLSSTSLETKFRQAARLIALCTSIQQAARAPGMPSMASVLRASHPLRALPLKHGLYKRSRRRIMARIV